MLATATALTSLLLGGNSRLARLAKLQVLASLPAFLVIAVALRRGIAFPAALAAFVLTGWLGYWLMQVAGRRWGWPV